MTKHKKRGPTGYTRQMAEKERRASVGCYSGLLAAAAADMTTATIIGACSTVKYTVGHSSQLHLAARLSLSSCKRPAGRLAGATSWRPRRDP